MAKFSNVLKSRVANNKDEDDGAIDYSAEFALYDRDDRYRFIAREQHEYDLIDDSPISDVLYDNLDDMPLLDDERDYYASFEADRIDRKISAYRESQTIGLPVRLNQEDIEEPRVIFKGKIKYKSLLNLDIPTPTPRLALEKLLQQKDDEIIIDRPIAREIVKGVKFDFDVIDDITSNDEQYKKPITTVGIVKRYVVSKTRSYLIRNALLKLGYDALETKDGIVLLVANRFMPMEVVD